MGFSYQKNFFNPTLPVDEAQFWALVKATNWNEKINKVRETGDQKLKRGLPAFIFQATFDETESKKGVVGAWRKQSATRLTGLVVMDIDHVDNPREVFESWGLPPTSGDFSTTLEMTNNVSSRLSEAPLPSSRLSEAHGEISPLTTFLRPSGSKRAELERSTTLEMTRCFPSFATNSAPLSRLCRKRGHVSL